MSELKTKIERARYARGMSIRSVAAELGVSTATIIAANRGDRQSAATVRKIEAWCAAQQIEVLPIAEDWRTIPGWEGYYEASASGLIRSVQRIVQHASGPLTIAPRILRPSPHDSGHLRVSLSRERQNSTHYVHTLVLEAFSGPKPFTGAICRHLNGIVADNRAENLRWGTYGENRLDAEWHALHPGEIRPSDSRAELFDWPPDG